MDNDKSLWFYLAGTAFALVSAGYAIHYFSPEQASLRACEVEIKSQLKAPATYKRVEAQAFTSMVSVTYDAANSFGVPIRSSGFCSVDKAAGKVEWVEMPS